MQNPALIRTLFIAILCAAALLRIYMVQLDINILLDQGLLQDDAFYYYEIARNIVATGFSSFDGINATNGFHPLWQGISVIVMSFKEGDMAARVMLGIAALFDMLSLGLIFILLKKLIRDPLIALAGVVILGLHGTIIRTWFNGLETALSLFLILLLLWFYLNIKAADITSIKQHILMGFCAALCFLARTDNAIIIIALFAGLYIPLALRGNLKPGLNASIILIFVLTPWLFWNYSHFGSIVQISGQIKGGPWLIFQVPPEHPFYIDIAYGIWTSIFPVGNVFKKLFIPFSTSYIYGYIFLVSLLFIIWRTFKKDAYLANNFKSLLPFIIGICLLFLYHSGVRHFIRGWYNAPVMLAVVIIICLLFDSLVTTYKNKIPKLNVFILSALTCVLLILFSPYHYTKTPKKISPDPRTAAAAWINQHTSRDTIIGSGNAGIVGFYTERPVINLDGVVNENAYHARLSNTIHQYIFESGITYLTDHKGSIVHMCAENNFYTCENKKTWHKSTQIVKIIPKVQN